MACSSSISLFERKKIMPYIDQISKDKIKAGILPMLPGELNYDISTYIDNYISRKGLSYTVINEVIGVLECAKLELYRRVAVPYEEKKRSENGEVYVNV